VSDIGLRLKKLREEKKMTQAELGNKIGVSGATINRYEKGFRQPDPEMLSKIADFFDVSVDYLLGRDDDTVNIHEEFRRIQESIPKWGEDAGQIALDETKKVLIKLLERGELTPAKAKPIIAFIDAMIEEFENEDDPVEGSPEKNCDKH